jgi:hypothetical protein
MLFIPLVVYLNIRCRGVSYYAIKHYYLLFQRYLLRIIKLKLFSYPLNYKIIYLFRRMVERRLTKETYEADLGGNAGRGRLRRTFLDQIGQVLEGPGQEYPKPGSVYEDRIKWKEVISAYPNEKQACCLL